MNISCGRSDIPPIVLTKHQVFACWVFFFALFAYLLVGVLPVTPLEGDGVGIAYGVESYKRGGSFLDGYRYPVQAGTYFIVWALSVISGADAYTVFAVLGAFCCVGFVIVTALLLNRITSVPVPICGLIVLLFPEVTAASYYANSKVVGAFLAVSGLYIVSTSRNVTSLVVAGCLLGFASFVRYSVLLVAPASLLLLYRPSWSETVRRTAILALVTLAISSLLLYLGGIDPMDIVKEVQRHSGTAELAERSHAWTNLPSYLAYFGLLMPVLIASGLILIAVQRRWNLIALIVFGTAGFFFFYFGKVHSPKYFYTMTPFFALPVVFLAANWPLARTSLRRPCLIGLVTVLVVAFFCQYFVGIRVYDRDDFRTPTLVNLFSTSLGGRFPRGKIEKPRFVIGAGQVLPTGDLHRLATGWLFLPLMWHNQKSAARTIEDNFRAYVSQDGDGVTVIAEGWERESVAQYLLITSGFVREQPSPPDSNVSLWKKGRTMLYLMALPDGGSPPEVWTPSLATKEMVF